MTLIHQPGQMADQFHGVYWSAMDGEKPVGCGVTPEALLDLARQHTFAPRALVQIYLTYRSTIQKAATAKYERGELEQDEQVLVKKADLGLEPKKAA
jgi:Protein of unknown function (DUF1488)